MKADDEKGTSSLWSREQNKAFENAVATHTEDSADRWERITADVPGKTLEEVKHHYDLLVEDVNQIESGCVPLPRYSFSLDGAKDSEDGVAKKGGSVGQQLSSEANHGGKGSRSDQERRKGIAWTEDEHRLFLLGLEKYGKGDWRSISRNFVVTRTPTQVASHAQKYFIRLNSMNKDRRRTSIHDITSVNDSGEISATHQVPVTGQNNNAPAAPSSEIPSKQSPQSPATAASPGMAVFGAPTIGQPIGGPLVSAIGTPVTLPPPHLAYGIRASMSGTIVPGAPMGMAPMPYPTPHTAAQR